MQDPNNISHLPTSKISASRIDPSRDFTSEEYDDVLECIYSLTIPEALKSYIRFNCWERLYKYDTRARRFYQLYTTTRYVMIVFTAIVPLLAGASALIKNTYQIPYQVIAQWAALVASLVVAICTGILGFARYGERWQLYRLSTEELRHLGWSFILLTGEFENYTDHQSAYKVFARQLDEIVNKVIQKVGPQIEGNPNESDLVPKNASQEANKLSQKS